MKNMTVENIINVVNGDAKNCANILNKTISGISIDSREVKDDFLFIAIVGENNDGHNFIDIAFKSGALLALVENDIATEMPHIKVKSSKQALIDLATFYRAQFDIEFIGIIGSVGKTSAKEMVASLLSQKFNVHKTLGNHNNNIGVPLTLFSLNESHEISVVEMGISDFGEMTLLSKILRPTRCVITNIGQAHLEQLKSREGIFKAKMEFIPYMTGKKRIYANGDDDMLATINKNVVFYGKGNNCSVQLTNYKSLGIYGSECVFKTKSGEAFKARLNVPGEFTAINAAAALAIACDFGFSENEIIKGMEEYKTVGDRLRLIKTDRLNVISDCYNANPVSMKGALDVLSETDGRRIAILGDMLELGKDETALHLEIGEYAKSLHIDKLLAVGTRAFNIHCGAFEISRYYKTVDELISDLDNVINHGDVVLVKASHGMALERVVKKLSEM
ncbi:MAG: UDP-N-acetylmuramoyl-tripeptide--D-alanyl-D-alanine ligase [Clostridia bacterium]